MTGVDAEAHPVAVRVLDEEGGVGPVHDGDPGLEEALPPGPKVLDPDREHVPRSGFGSLAPERPLEHEDAGLQDEPGGLETPLGPRAPVELGEAQDPRVEPEGALHVPDPEGEVVEAPHVSSLNRVSARP
jgi:hypothetical protein